MNLIIYKIGPIKTPDTKIYITKKNKKPLHNKCYRCVFIINNNKTIASTYIKVEHCVILHYDIPAFAANSYIHINDIKEGLLQPLTIEENILLQEEVCKTPLYSHIQRLFNMGLYNN